MYFLKELGTTTVLGTLFAVTAAAPTLTVDAPLAANSSGTREALTDHLAEINMYTGSACNDKSYQFTVSTSGSTHCQIVTGSLGTHSIQVSARYVDAHHMTLDLSLELLAISFPPSL